MKTRLAFALTALLLALPLSASAATINGTISFDAAGNVSGNPLVAGPGDVVNLTIAVNPLAAGIAAYGFAFDAAVGIEIQSLNALLSGSSSIATDKRVFSFNNALAADLTTPSDVATLVFNVAAGVAPGTVALQSGAEIVLGDFNSITPAAGSVMINVVPEPGSALLIGAGLAGLGLTRRRRAA